MDVQNCRDVSNDRSPFWIPQILNKVLSFLEIKSLHSMRLVNRFWNYEICMILRGFEQQEFSTVNDVKRFIHFYEATGNFPIKGVVLSSEIFDAFTFSPKCSEVLNSFGTLFGSHISSIHINVGKIISSVEDLGLKNIVEKYLINFFVNLKSLSILCYNFPSQFPIQKENLDFKNDNSFKHLQRLNLFMPGYERTQQEYLKTFLNWMYKLCPSLEVIKCWNSTDKDFDACVLNADNASLSKPSEILVKSIFRSIIEANTKDYLTKLQEIKMVPKLKEGDLRIISHKHLAFRKCYFILEESIQTATLSQFIHRQRLSLETLYLEFPRKTTHSFLIDLACPLPKLTTVVLVNYVGSVVFLNKCPGLTNLFLKNCSCQDFQNFQLNYISRLGLSNSTNQVLLAANSFHNLRVLELQDTDDETLQVVFETLPLLNSLTCEGDKISDEGICGESNKILKYLFESSVKSIHETLVPSETSAFNLNSTTYPAIGNLTRLQNIRVNGKFITDASILFGLLRCQLLKKLHIHSSLELITSLGFQSLVHLQNLERVHVWVRNKGWQTQKQLRFEHSSKVDNKY